MRRKHNLGKSLVICLVIFAVVFTGSPLPTQAITVAIYDDGLTTGWENWSWGTTIDLANTNPVYEGTNSIAVTYTEGWSALFLHIPDGSTPIDITPYSYLRFYAYGGGTNSIGVKFVTPGETEDVFGAAVNIQAPIGQWTMFEISVAKLGSPSQITGLAFQDASGGAAPTFYVDQIEFTSEATPGTPTPTPPSPSGTLSFTINPDLDQKTISPYIYGTNQDMLGDENTALRRIGGNRTTGYNWENNASNAGSDWLYSSDTFMCDDNGLTSAQCEIPGEVYKVWHDKSLSNNANSIITLQMAGYVAKDKDGTVTEAEVAPSARWVPVTFKKNAPFAYPPDTTDDNVYMDELVNYMVSTYGDASTANGVKIYSLDNEPALWSHTHVRIHPDQPTVEEIVTRSVDIAKAVKDVDANAEIFGPALYGFYAMYSFQDATDWSQYQAQYEWFTNYYLSQMQQASQAEGRRLLDAYDFHWYPEATGDGIRITQEVGTEATQMARMQAPRTFWDPTYTENSWIAQSFSQYLPILPKVQESIDTYYPDTKIAITEWSFGAGSHVSNGLASADALGIFGKYEVYASTTWLLGESDYTASAFRLYRNYDGQNSTFGNTSVQATTSDIEKSSIYASIDDNDPSVLHVVILNKSMNETLSGSFDIEGSTTYQSGSVWGFNQYSPELVEYAPLTSIANNSFEYNLPPLSAYHFILNAGTPGPTDTPTPTNTPGGPTPTYTPTPVEPTPTHTPTPTSTPSGGTCSVDYIQDDWGSGGTANVTIHNNSASTINGWTLEWTFPGNQQIVNLWNGSYTQSGASVSVSDAGWNGTINANGGTAGFGFQFSYSGSNIAPTSFTLNGVPCGGSPDPTPTNTPTTPTNTPTPTPQQPTNTPTPTPQQPTNTPTPTSTPPTPTNTPTPTGTPSGGCSVDYVPQNDWGSGATVNVTIHNNGASAINGWTLEWAFPGDQQITNLWGGNYEQSGASVSVSNAGWNSTIGAGSTVSFGFNLSYSGSNTDPTVFTLNGSACQ